MTGDAQWAVQLTATDFAAVGKKQKKGKKGKEPEPEPAPEPEPEPVVEDDW